MASKWLLILNNVVDIAVVFRVGLLSRVVDFLLENNNRLIVFTIRRREVALVIE